MTEQPSGQASSKTTTTGAPMDRELRVGVVTHTDFASTDPPATKKWCQEVLGWTFMDPMPMGEDGDYHMWRYDDDSGGGGIAAKSAPEAPPVTPFCEVPDIHEAFDKALKAGATEMMAPDEIPDGMGWLAVVQAPGGVPIGFWAPE